MNSKEQARAYRELAPRAPEGPFDIESFLPGDGDLEIDIGFGRGQSLLSRARLRPDVRLLGIERKSKWATKVAERCAQMKLANVRVLCEDARELLGRLEPAGSVSRIFASFPDPWWKKRHARRRLVDADFLVLIASALKDGGQLLIQTDVEERAETYRALLRDSGTLSLTPDGYLDENPFANPSNRERRASEDGLPVYRLLAVRAPRDAASAP